MVHQAALQAVQEQSAYRPPDSDTSGIFTFVAGRHTLIATAVDKASNTSSDSITVTGVTFAQKF
jgi:hypothetical protein